MASTFKRDIRIILTYLITVFSGSAIWSGAVAFGTEGSIGERAGYAANAVLISLVSSPWVSILLLPFAIPAYLISRTGRAFAIPSIVMWAACFFYAGSWGLRWYFYKPARDGNDFFAPDLVLTATGALFATGLFFIFLRALPSGKPGART
jgi:hypothetical protein